MTTETHTIAETTYGLKITPASESQVKVIQAIVDNIGENHGANFQALSSIEDGNQGSIARTLTEDEKNKVLDLQIGGEFTTAEETETSLKSQWQAVFIPFMRG